MAVPAVQRFGYGFVQGADAAAVEMGIADQVVMEYAYGNQFYGDSDITAYMDNWYPDPRAWHGRLRQRRRHLHLRG